MDEILDPIDHLVADELLGANHAASLFINYMTAAVRQGHLCIECNKGIFTPSPHSLWKENSGIIDHEQIAESLSYLPSQLIQNTSEQISKPVIKDQNRYYFQRWWMEETLLLVDFKKHLSSAPSIQVQNAIAPTLTLLQPEQLEAIRYACKHSLTFICGGPGTGKTYTAGHIIRTLWNSLPNNTRINFSFSFAAPTGKAASALQRSIRKATEDVEGFPEITATTIHQLLGKGKKNSSIHSFLASDFILIDECSMIDIEMMRTLFASVKPGNRLVMMGDPSQLPPVEAGGVWNDLIPSLEQAKKGPIYLNKCLRTELQTIVNFAAAVNHGNKERILELLHDDISHHNPFTGSAPQIYHALYEKLNKTFSAVDNDMDAEQLLHHFNYYRILSPLRRGLYGTYAINQALFARFEKSKNRSSTLKIPIMICKNDPTQNLFNGETGVLVVRQRNKDRYAPPYDVDDYAIFSGGANEVPRRIPALLLPPFEYGYCISVHKSQGSEFDHVLLLLPENSEQFGREMLYTAATRAKHSLEIWGSLETLASTLHNKSFRHSGIAARVNDTTCINTLI